MKLSLRTCLLTCLLFLGAANIAHAQVGPPPANLCNTCSTSLAASGSSARVIYPSTNPNFTGITIYNTSATVDAYVVQGDSTVTATTGGIYLKAGTHIFIWQNGTYLAAITGGGSATLQVYQAAGSIELATVGAGGSGGTVTSITAGTGLSGGTITTSGTIALLPAAAGVIGGVNSSAAVTHNFLTAIGTDGSVTYAQPTCADLSNASAFCSGTDAASLTGTVADARIASALTGKTYNGMSITSNSGTLAIGNAKTATISNTLTFTGTDGSTLNVGAGGTLGSNAFTSTAYVPLAGGTMTGPLVLSGTNLSFSGNISASGIFGTTGIRVKGVAATFNDTTSSGTIAENDTNVWGGNTLTATGATTITNEVGTRFKAPTCSTNVTCGSIYALAADSILSEGTASLGNVNVTSASCPANGIYLNAANTLGLCANSTVLFFVSGNVFGGITASGPDLQNVTATATVPSINNIRTDLTTGLGGASGHAALIAGGVNQIDCISTGCTHALAATFAGNVNANSITASGNNLLLSGNRNVANINTTPTVFRQSAFTINDTADSGTVAAGYINGFAAATVTATSATTFTNLHSTYLTDPVCSTNVTCTAKWALGVDSETIGTSQGLRFFNSGVMDFNSRIVSQNSSGGRFAAAAATSTVPVFIPNQTDTTTGIGAQASGNMSMIVGGAEQARFTSTGLNNVNIGATTVGTGAFSQVDAGTTACAAAATPFCARVATNAATYDLVRSTDATNTTTRVGFQAQTASGSVFFRSIYSGNAQVLADTQNLDLAGANVVGLTLSSTTVTLPGSIQLNVAAMTQTSAAQSGTMCYNSGTGAVTYDATLGCLASLPELKDLREPITGALATLAKITPRWASWKPGTAEWNGGDRAIQPVFNAREVNAADARLTASGPDGSLRGVRYMEMSAFNTAAINELNQKTDASVASLQRQVDDLKRQLGEVKAFVASFAHANDNALIPVAGVAR